MPIIALISEMEAATMPKGRLGNWPRKPLRGFTRLALPSGVIVADVGLHVSGDKAWAASPSKPMLDRADHTVRNADGKFRCVPIIAFAIEQHCDRLSAIVVGAVRQAHPEALR